MILHWEKEVLATCDLSKPPRVTKKSHRERGSAWCGHGYWGLRKIWSSADHTLNLSEARVGLLPSWPMTGWFYTADQRSSLILELLPRNHRPLKIKTGDFIHTDESYFGYSPWAHVHTAGAEYMFVERLSIDQQHLVHELSLDIPPTNCQFKFLCPVPGSSPHQVTLP